MSPTDDISTKEVKTLEFHSPRHTHTFNYSNLGAKGKSLLRLE